MNTRQTFSKVVIVGFMLCILFFLIGANGYGVIQIDSIQKLQKIGKDAGYPLNGEYELTQDIDASDTINWNSGAGFAPIGNDTNRFTGVFDGKGHKIRNLYINRPSQSYVGLFGYVSGAMVKNVGLENVQVVGGSGVGGLVGYNWGGTVSQSYSTGPVLGIHDVGGLVGRNEGTVSQSYSTGSVAGDEYVGGLVGLNVWTATVSQSYSTGSVTGKYNVGGLVGDNYGSYVAITQSYSTGSVVGVRSVGGLVGGNYNGGSISQSYSMGSVGGYDNVGGLVGDNRSNISQSYSTGSVSGGSDVGGLIGYSGGGTITQSYWDTETSGRSTSDGGEGKTTVEMKQQVTFVDWDFTTVWDIEETVTYPYLRALGQPIQPPPVVEKEIWSLSDLNKIGRDREYPMDGRYTLMVDIDASDTINWNDGAGFEPIGYFTGVFDGNGHVIQNLYINRPGEDYVGLFGRVFGEVMNIGLEHVQVVGGYYWCVGGLVGENKGTVSQSYSTGPVLGIHDVGGLVGRNEGTVSQSYSTGSVGGYGSVGGLVGWNEGTVIQSYSTGLVAGNVSVGGLVGDNYGSGATITQSYSTGSVEGDGSVGGLVGDNGGTVIQSYWDIETSGQSTSAGGEGKTTAEMKKTVTFLDWDFVNIWAIVEGETYPYLQVLGQPVAPPAVVVEKKIRSLSDLNKIGRDWEYPMNGHYTLMVDIDASETINWDEGKGFKPIILLGRFNGNNHVIRNVYINRPEEYEVGLFGRVYGEVMKVGLENVQVVGGYGVGGLVGLNVSAVSESYSTGSVVGDWGVGGLVGANYGTVSQSYSTGSVAGSEYVGGLVGGNGGTVTQSYSTGSVAVSEYVGGLVGWNGGGTVSQSYSIDSVGGGSSAGGLVGVNYEGTVSQSYWDIETSGWSTSAGGEGKTRLEMKQRATYVGWDFKCVWNIVERVDYPYLRWEKDEVPENCEGTVEGMKEGEGSKEGGKEGQVGTEGSPSTSEGEGSTETPTETKKGCGCGGKSSSDDTWWKYILDVILFGMLIVSMSGMRRRR